MTLVPAMKVYSFLEILANRVRVAPNHFLYVISTEDTVLYIGQSFDVTNRLRSHVYGRMDMYSFQHLFYSNLPACFSWVIHVFTLEDCKQATYQFYRKHYFLDYRYCLYRYRKAGALDTQQWIYVTKEQRNRNKWILQDAIDDAEKALIEKYHPCVNQMNNQSQTPLPSTLHDFSEFSTRCFRYSRGGSSSHLVLVAKSIFTLAIERIQVQNEYCF